MKKKLFLFIITGLVMMSFPASAHFDDTWDWHNVTVNGTSQYKTTVHYCFDASVNDTWKSWLNEAVQNWNNGATGWILTEGPPCQVTIKIEDIKFQSGGAYVSGFGGADGNGRISNLTMVFDSNLSDQLWGGKAPDGWGRTGNNTLDPVVVAKHEFGHALRLKHSGAGVDTGNLEDPVTPGNHNHTLSGSDKTEAGKGTINRTARVGRGNVGTSGGDIRFDKTYIQFREGSLYQPASILIRPLSHISTPDPWNVPAGMDGIIIGVDVRSDPILGGLEVPAQVSISYSDEDLAGAYFIGDLQITPLGPVDESSLKAYSYDLETNMWTELPDSVLDTEARTLTFDTAQLGFIGIGAKKLQVPGTQVIAGIVREITHSESSGLSTVVVEDNVGEMQTVTIPISEGQKMKVGDEVEITHSESSGLSTVVVEDNVGEMQTVTIPISEGQKMKVGDEVEITIYTVETEGVYSIGDLLEGTITNIQNFVSEGEAGTTMVTVMGPDGMEYIIAIPFVEGDLLSVGEQVQIPVTGADGSELKGAGTLNSEGDVVFEVSESDPTTEIEGTVTGIRHSSGRSILTIQDPEGAEHEVTVPLSEGEKIKIGVKVKVKILKSEDGTIESIDVSQAGQTPGFGGVLVLFVLFLVSILFKKEFK
jgi:hypothetical protein